MRRPHFLRIKAHGCARPNCYLAPVVRFDFDGIVLAFCATHAEDKAAQPGAEVVWLDSGWAVCPLCFRVLPKDVVATSHYNLKGRVCPPVTVPA